jgi:hypothetical protein
MAISARFEHARDKPSAVTPNKDTLNKADITARIKPKADNPIKTQMNVRMK